MKKVLILAYIFPPAAGSGVWRVLKFVKYLPSWGWQPIVVTPKDSHFPQTDTALLDEIPGEVEVHRVSSIEPLRLYTYLKKKGEARTLAHAASSRPNSHPTLFTQTRSRLFRMARFLSHNLVFVPDDHIGWVPFAVARGLSLIKKHDIDVVWATGDPFSTFVAGLLVSRLSGKPLVLDMRDPWVLDPFFPEDHAWMLHRFWERRCLAHAQRVVFVGEGFSQKYSEHYKDMPAKKFTFITHGYDAEDFQGLVPCKSDRFTISHIGTLTSFRTPDVFFRAVKTLLDENPELEERIRVRFVGAQGNYAEEAASSPGLQKVVEVIPYVDHKASLQYMLDSDALLLLSQNVPDPKLTPITGKVYEYLASGVPILALTPEAGAASMIREARAGIVVDPDDPTAIKDALLHMYMEHQEGERSSKTDMAYVQRFDRKALAGELSSVLNEVAGHE